MDEQLKERIVINPQVMVGKPVIRGTRVPVELIVRMLAQGISEEEILGEYPRLRPEDIRAALAYAAQALALEDILPLAISEYAESTMRFIVDESSGVAVAEYLRSTGHDVLAVSEIMHQAEDQDILILALNEQRILVTNDKDFGELVFRSGQGHHGVPLLRLRNESSANRVRVVRSVMESHANRLQGHFVVATETGVRIRPAMQQK